MPKTATIECGAEEGVTQCDTQRDTISPPPIRIRQCLAPTNMVASCESQVRRTEHVHPKSRTPVLQILVCRLGGQAGTVTRLRNLREAQACALCGPPCVCVPLRSLTGRRAD